MIFLPANQVWIGFDANGMSVAASIEAKKPSSTGKRSIMEGCVEVLKCRFTPGDTVFGRDKADFEVIK